jgi:ABC-2 type transport system permease protein
MNNLWTTIAHTAGRRIKSKTFVIATALMAAFLIVIINIDNIIDSFAGDSDDGDTAAEVAVVDETEAENGVSFGEMLASMEDGTYDYSLYTDGNIDAAIEAAEDGEFEYVLALTGDTSNLQADLFTSGTGFMSGMEINQDVQRAKEAAATAQLDLTDEELAMIFTPVTFNERPINGDGQTEESQMQAYWMVYGLVFAIYLIVITFGTMIATEVATEKSSRVMELIVSSINPVTQMAGKILGIGVAGLVNLLVLAAAAVAGFQLSGDDFLQSLVGDALDLSLIAYALLFIFLGYFLYGGVAAMLGALVSRAEEVNQAIQPLIFIAMIAFFIAIFGLNTPDAPFIQVLSYVPFFTPQLLFLRIGMGTVPGWEIAVIIGILILSAVLINLLAARIYKGGVLMYGKFSFKSGIQQALRLSKKEN